ncbi:MAG: aminopeptidase P family protein [Verrucomicrobia bacterium]|nr:aminopeptidase P family protein [Verrucomicrobiota bacterium]
MRYRKIDARLFVRNRDRLRKLLAPDSVAVVNANDLMPTNADGTFLMRPNSDLFYLTGVEQEETILLLAPDASNEKEREILFLREPNKRLELWEGHKLSKEEAREISGIQEVRWLSEFAQTFHRRMCEAENVYLNANEHPRAVIEVETRDARFVRWCRERYPLHQYRRLAPLMHRLRVVKDPIEVELLREACRITREGFLRVLGVLRPGMNEMEIEAEYAYEFTRRGARFAYPPIVAAGPNACALHYMQNDQPCLPGQLVLLDVGAAYANYSADLTRTVPVSGRFTRRQRAVYEAVLRVMRAMIRAAVPGKLHREWQKEAELLMFEELVRLGLLRPQEGRNEEARRAAAKKYFMHGLGHPLGLDVHDVGSLREPFAPGWTLTVEPGIYIPEEGFGVRLENDVLLTEEGPVDLMADIPVEPEEIETLMAEARREA